MHPIYTELKKKLITHSEYVLCCKSLGVGVMSIKVYIFGEEIFCRIHLWSQIYSNSFMWKKIMKKNSFSPKIALRCPKMLSMGQFWPIYKLVDIIWSPISTDYASFLCGNLTVLAKMVKKVTIWAFWGKIDLFSYIGFWTVSFQVQC